MVTLAEGVRALGTALYELGGWGTTVVFLALFLGSMRSLSQLQQQVMQLTASLAVAQSKSADALKALDGHVETSCEAISELDGGLGIAIKELEIVRGKCESIHDRLITLCARQPGPG